MIITKSRMNQQSFIYDFLLSPRFRVWRYFALVLFFTIVSVNQALIGYRNIWPIMGNNIYWITVLTILVYIFMVYLLQKKAIKLLFTGKYIKFVAYIFLCAVIFEIIPNLVFIFYDDSDFFSERVIVDIISSYIIYLLCISGVIIPVFLRNWLLANQHLNEMMKKQRLSQVERMKEQINPDSFFKILNRSASLVKSEPDRASAMLMKMGLLLRYQLYDCNRDKVLLTSEITFIRNFLEQESLYSPAFKYSITTTGNPNGIFIPPSILLPYVQTVIGTSYNADGEQEVDIQIDANDDSVTFVISTTGLQGQDIGEKELSKISERINTLYPDRYKLYVSDSEKSRTQVCLRLDRKEYAGKE